ncbi:Multiple polyol-specific dehydrogenase [hydrothermal vent metagenome]|uniref:Multiple polyol-specific dehydrogenase n=1 Tax=hydrothermal vent metagenome TaxID=652676 RepID=A0A3B0TQK2_9ZZZZ
MMRLSRTALSRLSGNIQLPEYRRSALRPGIVHIGVGNFHRAHQAVYMDDLFSRGVDHDWAIVGAGVRQDDARMRKLLAGQDFLSTVVELDPEGTTGRIVGSMTDFLPVQKHNTALVEAMARPETRIVSMTVTEGGYFIDPSTNAFDAGHREIILDANTPSSPQTLFGAIVLALSKRKYARTAPFTVLSCDNIPRNGDATQKTVTGLAALSDPGLAAWIQDKVSFPNAMVDRITPATGESEIALVRDRFHYDDPAPVTCEPFRQWILEDRFSAGRPRLEDVGVTFTSDVHLYENMKIRILNGGHAIIAYTAALLDIEFVHQAMADPAISSYLNKVQNEEVLPHVAPVPEMSPGRYLNLIECRFKNPRIKDTVHRLCFDGSNRQPKFIVPLINDRLRHEGSASGLALVSALWCRYCAGTTEAGRKIAPNDPKWDHLTNAAAQARFDPMAWLHQVNAYGPLAGQPEFALEFERWLGQIWGNGVRDTLNEYTDEHI